MGLQRYDREIEQSKVMYFEQANRTKERLSKAAIEHKSVDRVNWAGGFKNSILNVIHSDSSI
jgi:hypothetical protein